MLYSEEEREALVNAICERLMNGDSLRTICASEGMPNKSTVIRWMNADDDVATTIARARDFQGDVLFDDIQAITQDLLDGAIDSQAAKVAIWAKQWSASKLKPKKYGDKIENTVVGDPDRPVTHKIEFINGSPESPEDV